MSVLRDVVYVACVDMVLDTVPVIAFALDADGVFTRVEGRGLVRVGLTSSDFVGYSVFEIGIAYPNMIANIRDTLAGRAFTTVVEGRGCIFETRYRPIHDNQDNIVGVAGVGFDVTVQTRLSDELLRLQGLPTQVETECTAVGLGSRVPVFATFECSKSIELKPREVEILRYVARGMTNKEIASEMCLGRSTVKWYLDNLYCKLDVRSRAAAAAWMQKSGLLIEE